MRKLLLVMLLALPALGGRFDLPEGKWSNQQRPGFVVTVGDQKTHAMAWQVDDLDLRGTYKVTSAMGAPHVTFHLDSLKAEGKPVKSARLGEVPVSLGADLRSVWDWTDNGLRLTVQGENAEQLTVELKKI
ncbi:hypothetical protein JST97_21590 [bacterium]|nr:hypothetical protein [bacterium]